MTQQALVHPISTRRSVSSLLSGLFKRSRSATPNNRSGHRPDLAYDHHRAQTTAAYPALHEHEWAILMTMRPHS